MKQINEIRLSPLPAKLVFTRLANFELLESLAPSVNRIDRTSEDKLRCSMHFMSEIIEISASFRLDAEQRTLSISDVEEKLFSIFVQVHEQSGTPGCKIEIQIMFELSNSSAQLAVQNNLEEIMNHVLFANQNFERESF